MKITKRILKQLIKEELQNVMQEVDLGRYDPHEKAIRDRHVRDRSYRPGADEEAADEIETLRRAREDAEEREAGNPRAWQGYRASHAQGLGGDEPRAAASGDKVIGGPFGTLNYYKEQRARLQKRLDIADQRIAQLQGMLDRGAQ